MHTYSASPVCHTQKKKKNANQSASIWIPVTGTEDPIHRPPQDPQGTRPGGGAARQVWAGRGGDPPVAVARPGLCPGLGGGCSREGDVERPRGAARGRAGCGQPGKGATVPIARTKPEPQSRAAPPQQVGRTRAGAGAQRAAGVPGSLGVRAETFCLRSGCRERRPPHPLRLGLGWGRWPWPLSTIGEEVIPESR